MIVEKRNGEHQLFNETKVYNRLKNLSYDLNFEFVDIKKITEIVSNSTFEYQKTSDIDNVISSITAAFVDDHPDYDTLATRVNISKLHKETSDSFEDTIKRLVDANVLKKEMITYLNNIKCTHGDLSLHIVHDRDYDCTYFGLETLKKMFLLRINDEIVERPQYMYMRVALYLHQNNFKKIVETYEYLSKKLYTHGTPTMSNAGKIISSQLSNCFLLSLLKFSFDTFLDCIKKCVLITKSGGGIGLGLQNIPHKIFLNCMKILNESLNYANCCITNQRVGGIAVYLEPWHASIFDFLQLKRHTGKDEFRARDLFYALMIPDIFMRRVLENKKWSLFDPKDVGILTNVVGKDFDNSYELLEQNSDLVHAVVNARDIWNSILKSQRETGGPFIIYKDVCNELNMLKHVGIIRNSNLCTEIMQPAHDNYISMCNLASIALPKFVENNNFDFKKLSMVTKVVVRNLNAAIDQTHYLLEKARRGNLNNRPLGIGVQGLADVFALLGLPFTSKEAKILNVKIFKTIYTAAIRESCDLAKTCGPFKSYFQSRFTRGTFHHDVFEQMLNSNLCLKQRKDNDDDREWKQIREDVIHNGIRNCLFTAIMPTATTSQILGNNESVEPYTSNIYLRRTQAGEFKIVNRHLINSLLAKNIWNKKIKNKILKNNGSVQNISEIPDDIKKIYLTVWEISQKDLIDMASDRAPFIDQSQSLNIHLRNPTFNTISSVHFYTWQAKLKTGMYYLRTNPSVKTEAFTLEQENNDDFCDSCAS